MVAHVINGRMARRNDYLQEEVRVLNARSAARTFAPAQSCRGLGSSRPKADARCGDMACGARASWCCLPTGGSPAAASSITTLACVPGHYGILAPVYGGTLLGSWARAPPAPKRLRIDDSSPLPRSFLSTS